MTVLPVHDRSGNALIAFRRLPEADIARRDRVVLPASLIVVMFLGTVLIIRNPDRDQWELPGGTREPGEGPRAAAERELLEETGIRTTDLEFAGVAELTLTQPARYEQMALYLTRPRRAPRLVPNAEAVAFHWWPPGSPPLAGLNPIDAELARRTLSG